MVTLVTSWAWRTERRGRRGVIVCTAGTLCSDGVCIALAILVESAVKAFVSRDLSSLIVIISWSTGVLVDVGSAWWAVVADRAGLGTVRNACSDYTFASITVSAGWAHETVVLRLGLSVGRIGASRAKWDLRELGGIWTVTMPGAF